MSQKYRLLIYNIFVFLFIIIVPTMLVTDDLEDIESKNILLFILLVVYPCINLIIGGLNYKLKNSMFVSLTVSSISFVAVFYRYYNDSAYAYTIVYAGLMILGYFISHVVARFKLRTKTADL